MHPRVLRRVALVEPGDELPPRDVEHEDEGGDDQAERDEGQPAEHHRRDDDLDHDIYSGVDQDEVLMPALLHSLVDVVAYLLGTAVGAMVSGAGAFWVWGAGWV